jgi:hypothetical protein
MRHSSTSCSFTRTGLSGAGAIPPPPAPRGGIAYLADFFSVASIAVTHAIVAVLVAAVTIFPTEIPIAYYRPEPDYPVPAMSPLHLSLHR